MFTTSSLSGARIGARLNPRRWLWQQFQPEFFEQQPPILFRRRIVRQNQVTSVGGG